MLQSAVALAPRQVGFSSPLLPHHQPLSCDLLLQAGIAVSRHGRRCRLDNNKPQWQRPDNAGKLVHPLLTQ